MKYFVFIDNSNLWIEGKYASGVEKGLAKDIYEAHLKNVQDNAWRVDFGKLVKTATRNHISDVEKVVSFGSKPPESDSLWNAMRNANIEVIALDRNAADKEKAVDTGITVEIMEYLYDKSHEGDTFVLIMGDKDFLPAIEKIRKKKRLVTLVFWNNASAELVSNADEYIDLTPLIKQITY